MGVQPHFEQVPDKGPEDVPLWQSPVEAHLDNMKIERIDHIFVTNQPQLLWEVQVEQE